MTNFKKFAVIGAIVLAAAATSLTAFAASAYNSPAEAAAGLTGQTTESVIAQKSETGSTYGAIAAEAGVLDAFKAEMLEMKKDILAEKVAAGTLTQEEADEIIAAIEEHQATCDGSGSGRIGREAGAGFGGMNGSGQGKGQGGAGLGQGKGRGGAGLGQGSGCLAG